MLIGSIDVNEFAVIDTIASALGDSATAPWIRVGIGDDAAVMLSLIHISEPTRP